MPAARKPSCGKVEDQLEVQGDDEGRDQNREGRQPARRDEIAELLTLGCKEHERHDGERQLQTEDHLAEDQ